MILHTMTDEQIAKELETDLRWIKENAKKIAKKKLQKRISQGIASKDHVEDYELRTPNGNLWAISANIRFTKKRDIRIRSCCIIESGFGTKDYLILRGLTGQCKHLFRITSHTVSRMKERSSQFRDRPGHLVAMQIFSPRRNAYAWYARKGDIPEGIEDEDVLYDEMVFTDSGIYLGETKKCVGRLESHIIRTYIRPDMMYTHQQQSLYRYFFAKIELEEYCTYDRFGGAFCWRSKTRVLPQRAKDLLSIVNEYLDEQKHASQTIILVE